MDRLRRIARRILPRKKPPPVRRLEGVAYNDAPAIERVIFICGLHRSGTTLLENLLSARFHVSQLRSSAPESEGQHMQSVYAPARLHGGAGRFAFSAAMAHELETLVDHARHRDRLLADWSRFVSGTSPVLIEKSPPNLTKIAWLRQVFPGARFVILARDPRAVAAATQKWSGSSLAELVMHWNVAYSAALRDFDAADCVTLRYEDMVADPEAALASLEDVLALGPRAAGKEIDPRFRDLRNSNADYIAMHQVPRYGRGAWSDFGYDI